MSTVYLGLGSNVSDQKAMLTRARILINIYLGRIVKSSSLYRTAPWGMKDQDDFINQMIMVETKHTPEALHTSLLKIEKILKKHKTSKYGPRNIDIDILIYDDLKISNNHLEIPHPRMHERNFVLIPLAEIAPDLIHPVLNKTINELATECEDEGSVLQEDI